MSSPANASRRRVVPATQPVRARGARGSAGSAAAAAGLVLGLVFAQPGLAEERPYSPGRAAGVDASAAVIEVAGWVRETADNQGLPFLVIDKISAQVSAYDREGRLLGITPALLGLARGDVSPPGIGDRPLAAITPAERITPAGRYLASLGENTGGESILWIDYGSALSLHPVVTTRAADRRLQRLATASVEDNRISYGCVNVPATFYEEVVQTTFAGTVGVVYILPESRSWTAVFLKPPSADAPARGDGGSVSD